MTPGLRPPQHELPVALVWLNNSWVLGNSDAVDITAVLLGRYLSRRHSDQYSSVLMPDRTGSLITLT
jgi:hypothetical protein